MVAKSAASCHAAGFKTNYLETWIDLDILDLDFESANELANVGYDSSG